MFVHHLLAAMSDNHVLATNGGDVGAYMTPMRLWATSAALVGLIGVGAGALALFRAVRRTGHGGRNGAVLALASGGIAASNGAANLVVADGGPGTGNGVVGGALAIIFGIIATVLGGRVLRRSRHTDQQPGLVGPQP